MIQRIQTIWLLLAAIFAAITFRFPFYSGIPAIGSTAQPELNANGNILITILTVLTGATAFADIFLFENRKRQLKVCYLGLFFALVLLVVYFFQLKNYMSGTFALSSIFYFAILAFFILAARGISKDEKLIKSMDRLR